MSDTLSVDTLSGGAVSTATLVDTHLAAYCEPDTAKRAELVAAVWAPDGELLDPPLTASGQEELVAITDAVLAHFPDHRFRRTSACDEHHGYVRYEWELVASDGSVAVAGTDVVQLSADGRLARVVGFFGPVPPLDAD